MRSLALDRLTVRCGTGASAVRLLTEVTLAVAAGECLGVIGVSGAGKSTLARVLAGEPVPGATVDGERRVAGVTDPATAVGVVLQEAGTALAPHRSLGRQLQDVRSAARRRAGGWSDTDWLTRLGLATTPASLARYPFELSGGERQRAALALALCAGPHFLVADEPTSALDPPLAVELAALLAGLVHEAGLGLVYISHALSEVAALADRVAVLDAGRVVEAGPVDSVLTGPRHPTTRALLGAPLAPALPGQGARP